MSRSATDDAQQMEVAAEELLADLELPPMGAALDEPQVDLLELRKERKKYNANLIRVESHLSFLEECMAKGVIPPRPPMASTPAMPFSRDSHRVDITALAKDAIFGCSELINKSLSG